MSEHYILKDKKTIEVSLMEWGEWLQKNFKEKIVKQETLKNGKWVSTVFLGLDHSFGDGPLLLFETMVFSKEGEWGEEDMDRYTTYEEAEEGHKRMVEKWTKLSSQE